MRIRSAADLKPGEKGTVMEIADEYLACKLFEMGLIPGTEITLKYTAPLGDPIAIQVSGYNLSLRLNEASVISIA